MKLNFFILNLISLPISLPKKSKVSKGFTLTELLIGASLTLIVIGAAGFGLYQTTRSSKTGNNQAERRSEVARAYEFISDEMRKAKTIEPNQSVTLATAKTNATGFTDSGDVVLALDLPNVDNDGNTATTARVVYYVKDKPSGSVWKGPKILYRWGPPINDSGEYTSGAWESKPLIDQLDNNNISPSCPSGWTTSNAPGFAACIDPKGKVAQIYFNGQMLNADGSTNTTYSSNTKTAARTNDKTTISLTSFNTRNFGLGGAFQCQSPVSGTTPSMNTQLDFYTNPVDSTPVSTETIKSGGASNGEVGYTNKIKVTSTPTGCTQSTAPLPPQSVDPVIVDIKFNTPATNTTDSAHPRPNFVDPANSQVLVLYDYKDISNYNTQYEDQQTLKNYLKSKGVEFYVESGVETNKIKLNSNQLLLAFEIGQTSLTIPGTTIDNPGWDFQDNLVLINVK